MTDDVDPGQSGPGRSGRLIGRREQSQPQPGAQRSPDPLDDRPTPHLRQVPVAGPVGRADPPRAPIGLLVGGLALIGGAVLAGVLSRGGPLAVDARRGGLGEAALAPPDQDDAPPESPAHREGEPALDAPQRAAAETRRTTPGAPPTRSVAGITRLEQGQAAHRGLCFVPPDPAGQRPLLILLDPGGQADRVLQRWQAAAAAHGWLLASSPLIRNGTQDADDHRIVLELLDGMQRQFAVDDRRVYLGGFSGGGCGAYRAALLDSQRFRGAVVECGHLGPWRELGAGRPGQAQRYYLFSRDGDMNRPAMRELRDLLAGSGVEVQYAEGQGGHQPMSATEVERALAWLDR